MVFNRGPLSKTHKSTSLMVLITKIIPVSIVLLQTQTDEKPRTPKESLGISSNRNSLTDCDSENVNSEEPKIILEDSKRNSLFETKTENYELDIDPFVELEKSIEPEANVEIKSNKNKSRKQLLNRDPLNPDSLRDDFPEDTVIVNLDKQSGIDVMSVHEEKKHRFFCSICNKSYIDMPKHIKNTHHKQIKTFKCNVCEYQHKYYHLLEKHIKSVHEVINPFKCHICIYDAVNKTDLKKHIKNVHEEIKTLKCNICDYETTLDKDLRDHIESVHQKIKKNKNKSKKQSRKQSLQLDLQFYDFPETTVNLENQSEENGKNLEQKRTVICKICGFITTLQDLKSHMNLKHENRCSFCESKFLFGVQLEDHTESKHPGTLELKYFCSKCGDGFMFESNMVKHSCKRKKIDENKSDNPTNDIQTQADEKSRNSLTKPTLEKMIEIGLVSIIPHEENTDKYYEKRKQSLNLDSLRKEFPETAPQKRDTSSFSKSAKEKYEVFRCNKCDFDTSEKENLKRHVETVHEGIKTFNCTLCDYEFSKQVYLKTHIESVHEGIKPFKCHICQYETASKYFLKRHITLVHKSKNTENNENKKTQGLDLYYLEKTFNRANMSESVKKVYEGSLGISNAVVVNMEKGTKHCDINNQGVIFPSIKVERPTMQQSQTSDTADPLLIPEFKEEIFEKNEATPMQDLDEVSIKQVKMVASGYQNEQDNDMIDEEIKEEFNLGE